jgi:hypothetical protein
MRQCDKVRLSVWTWLAGAILLVGVLLSRPAVAQGSTRVGLVIDRGDGTLVSMIVTVSGANPTGYQVLQQSGLEMLVQSSGMGVAVCSIAGAGCPASNCFCDSPPNNWTYWHLDGDTWVYSPVGAGTFRVSDGAIEGWRWGPGDPPPVLTLSDIVAREASILQTGAVSAQQAYPGPETPVELEPFDPYPGPEETPPPAEPYPGPGDPTPLPVATETPLSGPSATPLRGTITLRPTYTPFVAGTLTPLSSTPVTSIGPTSTPSGAVLPPEATVTPAVAPDQLSRTPTADRVAILISTAVARDKQATANAVETGSAEQRSYAGFVVLAVMLLCLIGYVYLLRRQRRMRGPKTT